MVKTGTKLICFFLCSYSFGQNKLDSLETIAKRLFDSKRYAESSQAFRAIIRTRQHRAAGDLFNLGRSLYLDEQYMAADSAFLQVTELQPNFVMGYVWVARCKSALDPGLVNGSAKPYYEMVIKLGEVSTEKNKQQLLSAYQYLGGYYLSRNKKEETRLFFEKALKLDPRNEMLKADLELLDKRE